MSDITRARRLLHQLADKMRREGHTTYASGIETIVGAYMHREQSKPRTSVRSRYVTPTVASQIRKMARANPNMSAQEIANHFGVNPGRVSEAIAGKR